MSHALRTPLNAILGCSQLLAGDPADALTDGQRERVDRIHSAGHRLLRR